MKRLLLVVTLFALVSCGGSNTAPTPTPTPTPTTFTLTGTVTSTQGGAPVNGATMRVDAGPNANRTTTTDAAGRYTLANLSQSGFTLNVSATNFLSQGVGVDLTGNRTVDVALTPTPLFTRAGSGANVFDMPTTVSRIRIQATYGGSCENFIVHIAGKGVVNEILGTCSVASGRTFDGTFVTGGGVVEVLFSSGVGWTFTEVRQ